MAVVCEAHLVAAPLQPLCLCTWRLQGAVEACVHALELPVELGPKERQQDLRNSNMAINKNPVRTLLAVETGSWHPVPRHHSLGRASVPCCVITP